MGRQKYVEQCTKCRNEKCLVAKVFKKYNDEYYQYVECRKYVAGDIIPLAFFIDTPLIILEDGLVALLRNEQILSLSNHCFFYVKNDYTLETLTDVKICLVSKQFYTQFMKDNVEFTELINNSFKKHIEMLESRFLLFNQLGIVERILHSLNNFFTHIGNEIPFSVKFLANYCFTSKEEVSRSLRELREQNIIEINRKTIKLKKKQNFYEYINLYPSLRKVNEGDNLNHIFTHF